MGVMVELLYFLRDLPKRNWIVAAASLAAWKIMGFPGLVCFAAGFSAYLALGGWRFMVILWKTLPRDIRALCYLLNTKMSVSKHTKTKNSMWNIFRKTAAKYPDKAALVFENRHLTFKQTEEYANRVAHYFFTQGYREGDRVVLFKESSPEYVCLWLGLSQIGVVTALMNFNLRGKTLLHCIDIVNCRAVIFGSELTGAIEEISGSLGSSLALFCSGGVGGPIGRAVPLDAHLVGQPTTPTPPRTNNFKGELIYIYTSGTTGLPKAAKVSHSRYFYMANLPYNLFRLTPRDVIYCALPLYHANGGILGVGQVLISGCTLVIRKKFSASQFWDDCVKYNCTAVQYIGELLRYLVAQPPKDVDHQHRVRVAYGNGLKPELWGKFKRRFGIERIGEFYGSTEGNASTGNVDNTEGCVGFTTRIAPFLYPISLVRVDPDTCELTRNPRTGLCSPCEPGEPGQLIGKIVRGDPIREFDGYSNESASKKKVARDVFRKGDMYFLTGDILEMDEYGYLRFKDRTGDTFRWKGENVSTNEAEDCISGLIDQKDCAVYGVLIQGYEGRAGMAAIADPSSEVDLNELSRRLRTVLPAYAHPVFIRRVAKENLPLTSTGKLQKVEMRKEGCDPNVVKDALYYLTRSGYEELSPTVYASICNGSIRL